MGALERLKSYSSEDLVLEKENGFPSVTDQHKVFLQYYSESFDLRGSTSKSNMSMAAGKRALGTPINNAFLDYIIEGYAETSVLNKEWLELEWLELYNQLKGDVSVPFVDRDGTEIDVKRFHASESVSALKEMSKLAGMGVQATDAKGMVNVNINLEAFGLTKEIPIKIKGEVIDD